MSQETNFNLSISSSHLVLIPQNEQDVEKKGQYCLLFPVYGTPIFRANAPSNNNLLSELNPHFTPQMEQRYKESWIDEEALSENEEGPFDEINTWEIKVHGWLYSPNSTSRSKKLTMNLIKRILRVNKDVNSDQFFKERFGLLLSTNLSHRRLTGNVYIECNEITSRPTTEETGFHFYQAEMVSSYDGHFYGTLKVPKHQVLLEQNPLSQLSYRLNLAARSITDNSVYASGQCYLIPPFGISLISDIDDTIRQSNIYRGVKKLLKTIFIEQTMEVNGMADIYREWVRKLSI
jgi:hypothetical protein